MGGNILKMEALSNKVVDLVLEKIIELSQNKEKYYIEINVYNKTIKVKKGLPKGVLVRILQDIKIYKDKRFIVEVGMLNIKEAISLAYILQKSLSSQNVEYALIVNI